MTVLLPMQVLAARKEYVALFKKLVEADAVSSSASKRRVSALTNKERERFDVLEEDLPLQAILTFRGLARQEVGGAERSCGGN